MRETLDIDEQKYHIDEEEDSWLVKIYRLHIHWVNAYLKNIFWAVMTTSLRSKSINSLFNGFVNTHTKRVKFDN